MKNSSLFRSRRTLFLTGLFAIAACTNTAMSLGARISSQAGPFADLSVTMTATPMVSSGQTVVLSIGYRNAGPAKAIGATIAIGYPTELIFKSAKSPGPFNCTRTGTTNFINCAQQNLSPGASGSGTFTFSMQTPLACSKTLSSSVTITSNTYYSRDSVSSNNSAVGKTFVNCCGNAKLEGLEGCDDANVTSGDGCSNICAMESGWRCTGQPSVCLKCGNAKKEGTEGCDDGNVTNSDGCSSTCIVEGGWLCYGINPSVCQKCGNAKKEGTEGCDDANVTSGDGCSVTCTVESGYTCTGTQPSVCRK